VNELPPSTLARRDVATIDTAAGASVECLAPSREEHEHMGLCEALDRLLHKGAVLKGEVTISVANIDLVYLGFHMLLASVETARGFAADAARGNAHSRESVS
jgi:hypothetical protein